MTKLLMSVRTKLPFESYSLIADKVYYSYYIFTRDDKAKESVAIVRALVDDKVKPSDLVEKLTKREKSNNLNTEKTKLSNGL